jgi:nucleotide-binding universal stress UspA family protein
MIKCILVGLGDADATNTAVHYAIDLCRLHEARLTGVAVIDLDRLSDVGPVPIGAAAAAHELREHRVAVALQRVDEEIANCRSACDAARVPCRILREEGDPVDRIVRDARYHDLMICALGGHVFEHGVIDEPPDALVRLISEGVRPILAIAGPYRPIRKVLVAYSGSMESAKAMRRFVEMRLWPDAQLKIVTFQKPPEEARQLLADATEYCRCHGFETEAEYDDRDPHTALLPSAADSAADLIVIGGSGRRLLLQRLFGETALAVFRQADRPIFTAQ